MVKEKSRRRSYIKKQPTFRSRFSTPESQGDHLYKITLQFEIDDDICHAAYFIWGTDEASATHLKMPRARAQEYKIVEVKKVGEHTPGQGDQYYAA